MTDDFLIEYERTWSGLPPEIITSVATGATKVIEMRTRFFAVRDDQVIRVRERYDVQTGELSYTYCMKTGESGAMEEIEIDCDAETFNHINTTGELNVTRYQYEHADGYIVSLDVFQNIFVQGDELSQDAELGWANYSKMEVESKFGVPLDDFSVNDLISILPTEVPSLSWSPRDISDSSLLQLLDRAGIQVPEGISSQLEY